MLIEVCTDQLGAVLGAREAGADRIELVGNLAEGGTTPSQALIEIACKESGLPVMVMIRPRPGNFRYSDAEIDLMVREAVLAAEAGAAGVVFGGLLHKQDYDDYLTERIMQAVTPLPVTFHRAFDLAWKPEELLDYLIRMGVKRVLTSGGKPTAWEGRKLIRKLNKQAKGRIIILPGGGINADNVVELVQKTGVQEVHFSASNYNSDQRIITRGALNLPSPAEKPIFLKEKIVAVREALNQAGL